MRKVLAIIMSLMILGAMTVMTGCGGGSATDGGQVKILCFGDYFDPAVEAEFEAATGLDAVIDYFDTNEEMYPIVKNESVKYDVICASDYMIEKMAGEGLLAEINDENIPNTANLNEKYMEAASEFDPGNKYAVPHTWGTLGILYNTDKIKKGEITSWNDLWKEEYKESIVMPDSMRDTLAIALKAKGYSLNTTDEKELAEATDYLTEQKPLVYKYANDSARDMLLGGSADIAVVWNGEVLWCQEDMPQLDYVIPQEGSEEFVDCWAIPAAAENVEGAEKWIDFMLDEDVAMTNFEYLTFSIPNNAVIDAVKDDAKKMDVLFPADEVLEKCESLKNLGAEADDMYTKYWTKFKA